MTEQAGYSGTPLPRKLGVKPGHRVLLVGAPAGFDLSPLPAGAALHARRGSGTYDVVLVFCPDRRRLEQRLAPAIGLTPTDGSVWIAWPKQASGVPTDLSDAVVRAAGLATGLVDTKVCAVDATWSALRFVRRLADR